MRIAGGTKKGRKLRVPAGDRVRPTSDKVKQALFNILGERIVGAALLDLYAGAGGIGIEALSRGAEKVVFVDSSRESLTAIMSNVAGAGFRDRAEIIAAKVETFLRRPTGPYDIVFLDPPYAEDLQPVLEALSASSVVKPGGIVIAEHFKKQPSPPVAGSLALYREAKYGDTVLAFYSQRERDAAADDTVRAPKPTAANIRRCPRKGACRQKNGKSPHQPC